MRGSLRLTHALAVSTIHAGLRNTTESRGDVQDAITGIGKAEKRTCA